MASYKIKPGDTLSGIVNTLKAKGINTSIEGISRLNKISNPNLIKAG